MNSKDAKKQLEDRTAALIKLADEMNGVSESLSVMQTERSTIVKRIASGEEVQQTLLADLDEKIKEPTLRLEGLRMLVEEAQKEIEKAKTALQEANEERDAQVSAFVRQREAKNREKFIASLPQRFEKICADYIALCEGLAELHIGCYMSESGPIDKGKALFENLGLKVTARLNELKMMRIPAPQESYIGEAWPMIKYTDDLFDAWGIRGNINVIELARLRREQRANDLIQEFETSSKGK